jgi:hypothetical protein
MIVAVLSIQEKIVETSRNSFRNLPQHRKYKMETDVSSDTTSKTSIPSESASIQNNVKIEHQNGEHSENPNLLERVKDLQAEVLKLKLEIEFLKEV